MAKNNKKIDQSTTLKEIFEIEGIGEILIKYNVPCLSCPMASFEIETLKLGDICRVYGIDAKKLLEGLNNFLKRSKIKN